MTQLLIPNKKYFVLYLNEEEELYYKYSKNITVLEEINNIFNKIYIEDDKKYIPNKIYIYNNIGYICIDNSLFYVMNDDYGDKYYIKNINNIIPIQSFNIDNSKNNKYDTKKFNMLIENNNLLIAKINKLHLEQIPNIYNLIHFQNEIVQGKFTSKHYNMNYNVLDYEIEKFNKFCLQLPKLNHNFLVFRKQRLSLSYNIYDQFNNGTEETYYLPFSASSSYDFVKKWSNSGLILIINLTKESNYMVLYNQEQSEITLGPGKLIYLEKTYYNEQPIIFCNYENKLLN
jgi:hypothetical protein